MDKPLTFNIGLLQLIFHIIILVCSPNTYVYACKGVFNPNIPIFPPNSAEGLHFSAVHYNYNCIFFELPFSYIYIYVGGKQYNTCANYIYVAMFGFSKAIQLAKQSVPHLLRYVNVPIIKQNLKITTRNELKSKYFQQMIKSIIKVTGYRHASVHVRHFTLRLQ